MKSRTSGDRFRAGQTVALVLTHQTGHEQHNGKLTTVLAARRLGEWECADPRQPERGERLCRSLRYSVTSPYNSAPWYVTETMLRPVYDGEPLSTWAQFRKKTGIRMGKPIRVRSMEST